MLELMRRMAESISNFIFIKVESEFDDG
jgi:hypothetical protein